MARGDRPRRRSTPNRRRYIKWLGLGGVAGLAGCTDDGGGGDDGTDDDGTGDDGTGDDGTEMTTEMQGDIQAGGHFRVSGMDPPQTLSPFEGTGQGDYITFEWMYDRLTDYNRDFEIVPGLATDWEPNDDATAWTFDLREGVPFANTDKELLGEDVKATAELMASEDRVPGASADLGPLDRIEVLDDYRIRMHLTSANNAYPGRLAETGSWFNIVPKTVIDDRFDEITSTDFGTGPFTLTDFQADDEYVFEANDDWFGTYEDNELPLVDKMTFKVVPDPVAQTNALTDERVDALHKIQTSVRDQIREGSGTTEKGYTTSSFLDMVMLTTLETDGGDRPFEDVRVRKALKHAMDREAIAAATDGTMTPGHHDPVAPVHPDYAPFDPGLEFGTTAQPDEARRLLEEAGYSDGIDLPTPIYSTDFDERRGTGVALLQQQCREAGINFDIQLVSADSWLSDYWNQENGWYASGYAARMEQTTIHRLALHEDAQWNSGRWTDEDYQEQYEIFSTTTDEEEFVEAFHEAQRIMHLRGPWLIFGFTNQYAAANDYMGRYEAGPAANRDQESDAWLTSDAPEGPS